MCGSCGKSSTRGRPYSSRPCGPVPSCGPRPCYPVDYCSPGLPDPCSPCGPYGPDCCTTCLKNPCACCDFCLRWPCVCGPPPPPSPACGPRSCCKGCFKDPCVCAFGIHAEVAEKLARAQAQAAADAQGLRKNVCELSSTVANLDCKLRKTECDYKQACKELSCIDRMYRNCAKERNNLQAEARNLQCVNMNLRRENNRLKCEIRCLKCRLDSCRCGCGKRACC